MWEIRVLTFFVQSKREGREDMVSTAKKRARSKKPGWFGEFLARVHEGSNLIQQARPWVPAVASCKPAHLEV